MSELVEKKLNVTSIMLQKFDGSRSVELSPHFLELAFSEDIYSKYIKASIIVGDSAGIRTVLPIVGEEKAFIKVSMPNNDDFDLTMAFTVESITNVTKPKMNMESYQINLISINHYESMFYRHSISFKNEKISNILRNITSETHELENVDETNGNFDLIVPNLVTNKAIDFLTKRALNDDDVADFVFYQNLDGKFNFRSLKNLQTQDPVHTLAMNNKGYRYRLEGGTLFVPTVTREMFETVRQNSKPIVSGAFGNLIKKANPFEKSLEVEEFKFSDNMDKYLMMNKFPQYSTNWVEYISQTIDKEYSIRVGQKDNIEKWTNTRNVKSATVDNIVANIIADGDLKYKAGQIISYLRPSPNPEHNADGEIYDSFYAVNYLISSIMHNVKNTGEYEVVLELVTDTIGRKL